MNVTTAPSYDIRPQSHCDVNYRFADAELIAANVRKKGIVGRASNTAGNQFRTLDEKTKSLIALAIASRCNGDVSKRVAQAITVGASEAEIREVLGTAILISQ